MHEQAILEYIAEDLKTFVRVYTADHELSQVYSVRSDLMDGLQGFPQIKNELLAPVSEPRIYSVNELISYISVPDRDRIFLIGPVGVCVDAVNKLFFPDLLISEEMVTRLYAPGSAHLIRMGVMLFNCFADKRLDRLACYNSNCDGGDISISMEKTVGLLYTQLEYGTGHNSYEAEQREMKYIEDGNRQKLQESWREDTGGTVGRLSRDDEHHAKYLSIINVALSARAAIRGGLPYELAYSLSDSYCMQIDEISKRNLSSLETLVRNIQMTYTQLVAQQKGSSPAEGGAIPPLVMSAKNYIYSHLHEKISAEAVASAVGTHPNYLSRLFNGSIGISLYDYILREKINYAQNMLIYSRQSYSDIAANLGFASQSHLGKVFKKYTGMTLRQFRETYKKK